MKSLSPRHSKPVAPQKAKPRVSSEELASFFRKLSTLLRAGVALHPAMEFLSQSTDDPNMRSITEGIAERLAGGWKLSSSMAVPELGDIFPDVTLGIISLGEQTGRLLTCMDRLADLTEHQAKLRHSSLSALTYPCVLFVIIISVGLLFVFILGPGDAGMFSIVGGHAPWPTQVLIGISAVLHRPFELLLALVLLVGAAATFRARWRKSKQLRLKLDLFFLGIPIMGPLLRKMDCARMLYVIAASTEVGVPMTKALGMARTVCRSPSIRKDFDEVVALFVNGEELTAAMDQFRLFPRMVTSMIHCGLETGQMDKLVLRVAETQEEDVIASLTNAVRLVEPILLAFAGVMAVFLGLATLLPIFEVVNRL